MRSVIIIAVIVAGFALPAFAAPTSPVASKDGTTFTLEDLNVYWLRNLGKDGLLDFFQMMVIYQEGQRQNLSPAPAEINDYIETAMGRDIYEEFKQLYSEAAVRQMIDYTLTAEKYETWLRDKIRREKGITATESEAYDFFLENIDQFQLPEGVYISIISVDNRSQAEGILTRLSGGEDFNTLAGEVNLDPQMRAVRGELGLYRRGDGLPDPLESAAFSLSDGQYSGIIEGQNYHVVYCHQHYPEVSPEFTDVKEDLLKELKETKIDPYYFDEIGQLMNKELPRFTIQAELFRPEE